MIKKENLITLYPFNGQSPYLIDKFYIIGYNYLTLEKILIEQTPKEILDEIDKEIKEPRKGVFEIQEEPTILNEITNDYEKEGLDSKTILQMIFPHKLKCYYLLEDNFNIQKREINDYNFIENKINNNDFMKLEFNTINLIKDTRTIFSSNPQTGKNSKKSINGIAYTFYTKYIKKKIINKKKYTFYIPYTFCITSEYPFFSSFNQLLTCIRNLYSQESIYIPIEIILYNIITLCPSPLNTDVILDLTNSVQQENYFGHLFNKIKKREASVFMSFKGNNLSKNLFEDRRPRPSIPFKRYVTQTNIGSKMFNAKDKYKIEFNFLSGYPRKRCFIFF